jgi:ribonuclease J
MGVPKENAFILSAGDVLSLSAEKAMITDKVTTGGILVDGLGVGDVGNVVLHDRQLLSENGLIIVALAFEEGTGMIVSGPDIISRGFVYVKESEELIAELTDVVNETLDDCFYRNITDWMKLKNRIRDSLSDYLWKKMKRNPVILPIIMEV